MVAGSVLGGSDPGGRLMLNFCTKLATVRYIITLAIPSPAQLRRPEITYYYNVFVVYIMYLNKECHGSFVHLNIIWWTYYPVSTIAWCYLRFHRSHNELGNRLGGSESV